MGLSARIRLSRPLVCPDCGRTVGYVPDDDGPGEINTGGNCLRETLTKIGYGDNEYGKWIALTEEQAFTFAKACARHDLYYANEIAAAVMAASAKGLVVELEADW